MRGREKILGAGRGIFRVTQGRAVLKIYGAEAGASLLGISFGIPKQGLWMSIEANKEMTNSCLSPTPVFT